MTRLLVWIALLVLLGFRFFLSINAKHGDMYNNWDWGVGAAQYGLNKFYDMPKEVWPHSRPNQPPGSIMLHLASYHINSTVVQTIAWLNTHVPVFPSPLVWWWDGHGELIAIKLPSILADMFVAGGLYVLTKRRVWSFLYLLNPVSWYISSYWGQTDTVVAAITVWSLVFLKQKILALSALFLGWSLITKASWAPFALLWLWYVWKSYRDQIYKVGWIIAPVILVSLPFHPRLDVLSWLINLYTQRILPGESGFITVNAFNFWHLIYGSRLVQDTIIFLGLPALWWGYLGVASVAVLAVAKVKADNFATLIKSGVLLQLGYFMFAARMHERYSFPAWILLTIYMALVPKKWVVVSWIALSALFMINVYHLWFAPTIPQLVVLYTDNFNKVVSVVYLLVLGGLVWANMRTTK